MTFFTPKMEILPTAQRQLWPCLKPVHKYGFVLYGGTAVALRYGHRISVDFDFFTDNLFDKDELLLAIPKLKESKVIQDQPQTLTVIFHSVGEELEPVKLSFFGGINFGRVGVPDFTDDNVLQVASPKDLMATKLKVLLQRVEAKDYKDIAKMIDENIDLAEGLASAGILYGDSFQPSECLKALTFFEGGDLDSLEAEDKQILIDAVRKVDALPTANLTSRKLCIE